MTHLALRIIATVLLGLDILIGWIALAVDDDRGSFRVHSILAIITIWVI